MVKKRTLLLLIIILSLSISLVEASNSKQRVYDYAKLLKPEEIAQLEKKQQKNIAKGDKQIL